MLEHFFLEPGSGNLELIAFGMAKHKQTAGREDARQIWIVQQFLGKGIGAAFDIFLAIRRVGEHEIELFPGGGQLCQCAEGILHSDI